MRARDAVWVLSPSLVAALLAPTTARAICDGDLLCDRDGGEACSMEESPSSDPCLRDCGRCPHGCIRDHGWDCAGGGDGFGGCVRTHVCSYPALGGCDCCQSWYVEIGGTIVCVSCVDSDEIYRPPPVDSCVRYGTCGGAGTCNRECTTCCDDGDAATLDACGSARDACVHAAPAPLPELDIPCDTCGDLPLTLVVQARGEAGAVLVTSTPDQAGNGSVCYGRSCVYVFAPGSTVTLAAQPMMCGGSAAGSWGGACRGAGCELSMADLGPEQTVLEVEVQF